MTKTLLPESSPSPWPFTCVGFKAGVFGVLFSWSIQGSRYVFSHNQLSAVMVVAMILGTMILGGACTFYMCRWIAGLDELQRLIQFKAFAFVFPGFIGLLVSSDLLGAGGVSTDYQWGSYDAFLAMVALYFAAFLWLWWRNR